MSTLLGDARIRVRPDLSSFHSEADRQITSSFKRIAATATAVLAGVGAAAFAKSTLDVGRAYQNSLNTLQAVSQATDKQLQAVSKTAKELGSDLTLPATSAADAAAVMTELAKASFTVEEAQAAAKGSLQLAAAAQIDGARAATIQAAAIQAFSLKATDAGHVSDVLANAANASAAEITDVSDALAQASAVAAASQISIEDTAAAIGILANNGIRGSDAGTLLKSAILALQSPSGPAQKAMDSLSLSAYDASGNFVGLSSIFGQLADAQKKMTPEAYAFATSTLFGSDAARLAGIAGKEGSEGFDAMAAAMGREGAAADVAAAKSKGVGGAIEALKSQFETFQIDLFERGAPGIEKFVRYVATAFPKVGDAIIDGVDHAFTWLADHKDDAVRVFGDIKDGAVTAFTAVREYVEPVTSELDDLWASLTAAHGPASAVFDLLKVGAGTVLGLVSAARPLVEVAGGILGIFNKLPGPIQSVVLALVALKVATSTDLLGRLSGRTGLTGAVGNAGQSLVGFAQVARVNAKLASDEVGRIGAAAGGLQAAVATYFPKTTSVVRNAMADITSSFGQARLAHREMVTQLNGAGSLSKGVGDLAGFRAAASSAASLGIGALRSAGSGLVGFLGGPWGIALAAGGLAVGSITSAMQKSEDQTQEWAAALAKGGQAAVTALREASEEANRHPDNWLGNWFHDVNVSWGLVPDLEEATKASGDYWRSLDPIAQAQSKVSEWTNTLSYRMETLGKHHKDTAIAQERLASWTDILASRQGNLEEATGKSAAAQEGWLRTLSGAITGFTQPLSIYQGLLAEKQAAEQQTAQATADATASTSDSWKDYAENVTVSLAEVAAKLEEQLTAQADWRTNIGLIAQWAGADVANYLAAMGEDGVQIVAQMADGSTAEAQRMRDDINRVIQNGGTEWVAGMDNATRLMAEVGKQGATATVDSISKALDLGVWEVAAIASRYGVVLAGGVDPLLAALGKPKIMDSLGRGMVAAGTAAAKSGGYADGGYTGDGAKDEPKGIVHGGEFVFTKEETRKAGVAQLAAYAKSLRGYANGGFVTAADVPRPYSTAPFGVPLSSGASVVMEKEYAEVTAWLKAHAEALGGPIGSGSFGSGSWGPIWTAVKAAFPLARINSTFRAGDPGYHGRNKAIDLGFGSGPGGAGNAGLASIARFLYTGYGKTLAELIYDGIGDNTPDVKDGMDHVYNAATRAEHRNHVHAAVYDNGGVLQPGMTGVNRSGKPEAVFTNDEWGVLKEIASGGGTAPLVGGDLVLRVDPNASLSDQIGTVMHELRKIKRGGGRRP